MKNLLLLLITLSIFPSFRAQETDEVTQKENKFIYGETIKLFLGDKIFVEVNVSGNSLVGFKIVKGISDSAKTMTIAFTYDNFGMQKATILKISNPFESTLKYKAKIKPLSNDNYSATSIVPVFPKIFSMETRPCKIESIILFDFKLEI